MHQFYLDTVQERQTEKDERKEIQFFIDTPVVASVFDKYQK